MIGDVMKLMRPQQWYKNLLIFLPIVFAGMLFQTVPLVLTLLGFVSLCLVSSANYIFNDIIDVEHDRRNAEKKHRPIASGKISIVEGAVFAKILLVLALLLALYLGLAFFGTILFLFSFTLLYSAVLKKEIFLDLIAIGINFVARAASGAFIIDVRISPWLIICVFFLSFFLSTAKRHAEVMRLGKKAKLHRKVLGEYTQQLTTTLMIMATTILIIAYSLYSFLSVHPKLFITLPIAWYVILRYFQLTQQGSVIARHPEKVISDIRLTAAITLWGLVTLVVVYWPALF